MRFDSLEIERRYINRSVLVVNASAASEVT